MVSGGIRARHYGHPSSDGSDARRASSSGGSVVHTNKYLANCLSLGG